MKDRTEQYFKIKVNSYVNKMLKAHHELKLMEDYVLNVQKKDDELYCKIGPIFGDGLKKLECMSRHQGNNLMIIHKSIFFNKDSFK